MFLNFSKRKNAMKFDMSYVDKNIAFEKDFAKISR